LKSCARRDQHARVPEQAYLVVFARQRALRVAANAGMEERPGSEVRQAMEDRLFDGRKRLVERKCQGKLAQRSIRNAQRKVYRLAAAPGNLGLTSPYSLLLMYDLG